MSRWSSVTAIVLAFGLASSLSACASGDKIEQPIGGDIIAPLTVSIDELQGESFELQLGQVLNIDTGEQPVDGFSGETADPAIAKFIAGREDSSALFNPGVEALAEGSTEVTITSETDDREALRFEVTVVPR